MQVWECKIVVPDDAVIPCGFDLVPRQGAVRAIESAGVPVVACFSGWGARLTGPQERFLKEVILPGDGLTVEVRPHERIPTVDPLVDMNPGPRREKA